MRTKLQIIAHRGASAYAPENTLAAFSKAIDMGAAAFEFDVQQTRDMKLVVIHDPNLRRLGRAQMNTGRVRKRVRDMDFAELSGVNVGSWFAPEFKDQRVPLLSELLDLFEAKGPRDLELHLEIKNERPFYEGIERRVLEALDARPGLKGRVVISSFNHPTLHRVRALDPRARLGYLMGLTRRPAAIKEAAELGCESVHLSRRRVSRRWVEAAHAASLRVLVYTVNTPRDAGRMAALEVDGIFTNFPDLAVAAGLERRRVFARLRRHPVGLNAAGKL